MTSSAVILPFPSGVQGALLILAPLVACFLVLGASARAAGYCVPIFVILCLIGERGLRRWKRLWRVD